MNQGFEAKPRKTEKVWMWVAISLGVLLFFLLLVKWLKMDLWSLILISILILILLIYVFRPTPPFMYDDAIDICRVRERKFTGRILPRDIGHTEVVPMGNKIWLVYFRGTSAQIMATYRVDAQTRAIIGRELSEPATIIRATDRSETLKAAGRESLRRAEEEKAAEAAGIDPEAIRNEPETDD